MSPSAPSFVIVVALEATPRVVADVLSEGEMDRLLDWLRGRPELALVLDAVRLMQDGEAA